MTQLRCRQLIEARLEQWALINDIPLGVQSKLFKKPPLDKPDQYRHILGFQLPGRTVTEDMEGTHELFPGVYAINIITPKYRGPAEGGRIVGQLKGLFKANLDLTAEDGFTVTIVSPLTDSAIIEGDVDDTTPTSFEYQARTIT